MDLSPSILSIYVSKYYLYPGLQKNKEMMSTNKNSSFWIFTLQVYFNFKKKIPL